METHFFPANDRGVKDIGWLKSRFFFSFSDYYHPLKSTFGTLVAFNDDLVEVGKGFGIHPHVNMEIISILLQGKMNHKDSMGYVTEIEEDGVQIMSAGNGLRHEEYNTGWEEVNFLQIWIQPKLQNINPRYQVRHFPRSARHNQLVKIVSGEEGLEHCWINQNAKLFLGCFSKGKRIEHTWNMTNTCLFIFVISGRLKIYDKELAQRDAFGVWESDNISMKCIDDTDFLIIETPINQK